MATGKRIDCDWLREHYPRMTDIHALQDEYERAHGWRPAAISLYNRARAIGVRKEPVDGRGTRAARSIYWSKEPEMERWMLDHDHGQRTDELRREWRERWGFDLSRGQVNLFRASHGTQTRRDHRGGRHPAPLYTEREGKDGYVVIKVRERAMVPMSKDNWVLKHVWVWEQANGPLPEGHVVYFADGDKRNFSPENLVAVPQRVVALINSPGAPRWHDAKSLRACVALAQVKSARKDAEYSLPRTCSVCGKEFVPTEKQRREISAPKTCPECLAAGYKAHRLDWDEIVRLHESGLSYSQVARAVGCTPHHVGIVIKKRRTA